MPSQVLLRLTLDPPHLRFLPDKAPDQCVSVEVEAIAGVDVFAFSVACDGASETLLGSPAVYGEVAVAVGFGC